MSVRERQTLHDLATECVSAVAEDFGRSLDWSVDSLAVLDEICAELIADGSLEESLKELWFVLVGAYTGEVVVRAYHGQWVPAESAQGMFAVRALDVTGFPFVTALRVLSGEPCKSLVSFARALPAISECDRTSVSVKTSPAPLPDD
jgi:hypothetical protein